MPVLKTNPSPTAVAKLTQLRQKYEPIVNRLEKRFAGTPIAAGYEAGRAAFETSGNMQSAIKAGGAAFRDAKRIADAGRSPPVTPPVDTDIGRTRPPVPAGYDTARAAARAQAATDAVGRVRQRVADIGLKRQQIVTKLRGLGTSLRS